MKRLFAPGCALYRYKPGSIEKIAAFLLEHDLIDDLYLTCCKESAPSDEEMTVIDCCPGCSHRFMQLYPHSRVISLWRVLIDTDFPFPDYAGQRMSIHDSCHSRNRNSAEMQQSARALCEKMHITLVEPALTRDDAPCCGGCAPDIETRKKMAHALAECFPEKNAVVYCTGCTRSLSVTKVSPRHVLDLLFEEPTEGLTLADVHK